MSKKLKKRMKRVLIGALFFAFAIFSEKYPLLPEFSLWFFLVAYFVIGGDVVKKAVSNILHGQVFDENFLMTIATIGAFLVS